VNGEDSMDNGVPAPTIGERLRSAREAQGLSLDDVAARTRIPMRHLQQIERGDYAGLPAPTYSAGFIKTYARLVGLDGQALSDAYRAEIGGIPSFAHQTLPYEPADPRRTPPAGLALLMLVVAVVLGLGYLYWRGSSEQPAEIAAAGPAQAPAAAPARPAQAPAVVSAPPASGSTGPVVIAATGDVWLKVADGTKTLFMGVLKTGDHYQVPADAVAPTLTTGRPGATQISVGQTPIPTVGDPDRAAKDVSLKADALLARVAAPAPAAQPPAGAPTPVENSAGPT
jgi:cytoskeleton protein RodZ